MTVVAANRRRVDSPSGPEGRGPYFYGGGAERRTTRDGAVWASCTARRAGAPRHWASGRRGDGGV